VHLCETDKGSLAASDRFLAAAIVEALHSAHIGTPADTSVNSGSGFVELGLSSKIGAPNTPLPTERPCQMGEVATHHFSDADLRSESRRTFAVAKRDGHMNRSPVRSSVRKLHHRVVTTGCGRLNTKRRRQLRTGHSRLSGSSQARTLRPRSRMPHKTNPHGAAESAGDTRLASPRRSVTAYIQWFVFTGEADGCELPAQYKRSTMLKAKADPHRV
jgi:hypothetical protein